MEVAIPVIMMILLFGFLGIFVAVMYFLYAFPLYRLGKKLGYDKSGLVWIPFIQSIFFYYVLADISGKTDFSISPKLDKLFRIKSRKASVVFIVVAPIVISIVASFVNVIPTLILSFSEFGTSAAGSLLTSVIPSLCVLPFSMLSSLITTSFIYAYLRDIIDMFSPDKEKNKNTALIVTIVNMVTSGLALPIYLIYLQSKEPLPIAPAFFAEEAPSYYGDPFMASDMGMPPYYPASSEYAPPAQPDPVNWNTATSEPEENFPSDNI